MKKLHWSYTPEHRHWHAEISPEFSAYLNEKADGVEWFLSNPATFSAKTLVDATDPKYRTVYACVDTLKKEIEHKFRLLFEFQDIFTKHIKSTQPDTVPVVTIQIGPVDWTVRAPSLGVMVVLL